MLLVWLFNKRAYPELTLIRAFPFHSHSSSMRSRRIFGAIQRILSSVLVRCYSARRSRLSCALPLAVHSTSATGTRRKRAVTPSFDYRSWLAQPCLSHQSENVKVKKGLIFLRMAFNLKNRQGDILIGRTSASASRNAFE